MQTDRSLSLHQSMMLSFHFLSQFLDAVVLFASVYLKCTLFAHTPEVRALIKMIVAFESLNGVATFQRTVKDLVDALLIVVYSILISHVLGSASLIYTVKP